MKNISWFSQRLPTERERKKRGIESKEKRGRGAGGTGRKGEAKRSGNEGLGRTGLERVRKEKEEEVSYRTTK
jgi:hypothetical protein